MRTLLLLLPLVAMPAVAAPSWHAQKDGYAVEADGKPKARLLCRCAGGALQMVLVDPALPLPKALEQPVEVTIGSGAPTKETWYASAVEGGLLVPDARPLKARLAGAKSLRVAFGERSYRFTMSGFGAVAKELDAACPAKTANLPAYGELVPLDELPRVVRKAEPKIPAGWKGNTTVLVQALVNTEGKVLEARPTSNAGAELDGPAAEAVRQYVFKPAISKGQPRASWVTVPVSFYAP